ncbi:MAG: DUF3102 domain-containing protein [Desulfitobacterium sp.]
MRMGDGNRTPEQIAFEINTIREQSGKMLLINAVEIGRRLTEAKELVPHGEWLKWLTESVSYSRSTASRLMKVFREYGPKLTSDDGEENPNVASMHHLNYTQGLILFGIPAEDREQFIEEQGVETMSQRGLRLTIKEKDPAKTSAGPMDSIPVERITVRPKTGSVERPVEKSHGDSMKYDAQYAMHRDNMLKSYEELLKTLAALNRIDPVRKEANRKEALKITSNMTETLKIYPPQIKTNLKY